MFHIFYLFKETPHLIVISSVVFIILNLLENIIHYNIGRSSSEGKETFQFPKKKEFIRIIIIMIIFSILQGVLTWFFVQMTAT